MENVAIAVAQFAPTDDRAANIESIRILASRAATRGAHIVVFPEYSSFFTPDLGPEAVAAAEPLDGHFAASLAEIAAELGVFIVAGMLESSADTERFTNTVVAFNSVGERVSVYRKIHLYDAFGMRESDWVVPGEIEDPELFNLGGFTVGIQTCYDVRFPEMTRHLVDAGANLVLLPAEWVRGPLKEHHWQTLVTARALENTVYVAASGQAPPVGVGNSMIVDPSGVTLTSLGAETDVAIAWANPARLQEVRTTNPSLNLRRFRVVPGAPD